MRTCSGRHGPNGLGRTLRDADRLRRTPGNAPGIVVAESSGRGLPDCGVRQEISEEPVSDETATELQAILNDLAGAAGMTATLMTAAGTWSGAAGKADGVRDIGVDDQFAIASVTKSVVAAQVMQMVEAGELGLDDPAAEHLPADLDFDDNGATIRQLLGHRSGLPGYDPALFDPALQESPSTDPLRVWTAAEMLDLVLPDRRPAGETFEYTNTNYLLLGQVIEQLRGRPIAEVLRDGVLHIDGVERLIYEPDEAPSEPMAMPFGKSTDVLDEAGGYLPSLAGVSVDGAAAAMASDSPSLARWWRAFCAGAIVPNYPDRDDDDARRIRTGAVRTGPPGDRGAWRRARRGMCPWRAAILGSARSSSC